MEMKLLMELLALNLVEKPVTNLLISNIFSRDPISIHNCK